MSLLGARSPRSPWRTSAPACRYGASRRDQARRRIATARPRSLPLRPRLDSLLPPAGRAIAEGEPSPTAGRRRGRPTGSSREAPGPGRTPSQLPRLASQPAVAAWTRRGLNVPTAADAMHERLAVLTRLGQVDTARLPGPLVDVTEQLRLHRLEVRQVEAPTDTAAGRCAAAARPRPPRPARTPRSRPGRPPARLRSDVGCPSTRCDRHAAEPHQQVQDGGSARALPSNSLPGASPLVGPSAHRLSCTQQVASRSRSRKSS